jgi:DNA-binding transcriptional LysR family regulator
MIDFEHLRALHAIATLRSVNRAARMLNVTPSAISQRIARLEIDVGQPVLERTGRSVRPTVAGAALIEHVREMLALMERAEAELDAQRDVIAGQVTVAAFPTAARGLGPPTLRRLRETAPQLRIALTEREPPEALEGLLQGEFDLVIGQDWVNAPLQISDTLSKTPLLEDVADIAMPASHRLAKRNVVELDELRSDPWITWTQSGLTVPMDRIPASWCRDWLLYTLRSRGHEPLIAHTAGELATQLALVAAGLGVCVLPRLGRDAVPRGVRVVPVNPSFTRNVYVAARAATLKRPAIAATIDAFCASAALAQRNNAGVNSTAPERRKGPIRRHRRGAVQQSGAKSDQ